MAIKYAKRLLNCQLWNKFGISEELKKEIKLTLGLNYKYYIHYIPKLKPDFNYQHRHMYKVIFPYYNGKSLPSHTDRPNMGDYCHLSCMVGPAQPRLRTHKM